MAGGARALLEAARLGVGRRLWPRRGGAGDGGTSRRRLGAPHGFWYEHPDPFTGVSVRRFARVSAEPTADIHVSPPGVGTQTPPAAPPPLRVGDRLPLRVARWRGHSLEYFWQPAPAARWYS